jgi:hypothetical protein
MRSAVSESTRARAAFVPQIRISGGSVVMDFCGAASFSSSIRRVMPLPMSLRTFSRFFALPGLRPPL